ncbi:hypothetical protein B7P43_G13527 [Cryptotermes secundus]|uniref:Ionotropic glutamate receptor C-terminal domain-containing protein n=1 Tax=Cryptotermes secundus TaxID=105785 RepID=A0A2J7PYW8_9NEOP|nr:hypothetical protein B7P43_G13527 [Cryptotermes secundus]
MILRDLFELERNLFYIQENYGGKRNQLSQNKYENYILISYYCEYQDVVRDTAQQISRLYETKYLNSRAKFVVVSVNVHGNLNKLASDLFSKLWKWKILNAILVAPVLENGNTAEPDYVPILDVYTWFPYKPPGHCTNIKDAALLDQWVPDERGKSKFLYNISLFPSKIPDDFHGCELRVSTFEFVPFVGRKKTTKNDPNKVIFDEGLEVRLLEHICMKINMSIHFLDLPADGGRWGINLGNGSWTGVTGEIIRSYSDIATGNWWYRCHLLEEAECLTPHSVDQLRWYIPCAKPYPRWMSISRVFKLSLWLAFLSFYVVVSTVMWLVVKLSNNISTEPVENQAYTSLMKCLLNFWAIILEESASNNPPHVAVIRAVFFMWVLYCWALNTVYQTYMTSYLINPGLQHQISSEAELLDSGMTLGIPQTILSLIPSMQDEPHQRYHICQDLTACEDRMAFKGDMAFFFSKYGMGYFAAAKYLDGDSKKLVCQFDEIYSIQLATFPVPRGSQLLETFNKIIMDLLKGGFMEKWWKDLQYSATLDLASNFNLPPGEYIKLTLQHLQSAFYFLFLGCILSIFALVSELFCCRKQNSSHNNMI